MLVNHYLLNPAIRLCQSVYLHAKPDGYAYYLRRCGFDAKPEDGRVVVYHAVGVEPDERRHPVSQTPLSPDTNPDGFLRALNAHIGRTLQSAGFLRRGGVERREFISPEAYVKTLVTGQLDQSQPVFRVGAHLRWTWDTEHHSGHTWIVPLASRRILSSESPNHSAVSKWLLDQARMGKRINGLDLATGKHRLLEHRDGRWGQIERGEWRLLDGEGWRVTLDMEALEDLGYSEKAHNSAQFTFDGLQNVLHSSSPFAGLVKTLQAHEVPSERGGRVSGSHLRFARGLGRDLRDVLKLGVLKKPPHPVRLTVVASRRQSSEEEGQKPRQFLNAHPLTTEWSNNIAATGKKII